MTSAPRVAAPLPRRAGVGFKPEHFDAIMDERPDVGFFEIHAENYMGDGGPPHRRLEALRARYPLSLHGVGLSIGGPRPLDRAHLARLAALNRRYEPGLFSEHLAWSSHDVGFLDDLLPLPLTAETLAVVCRHIDETQEAVGRRMLLENPSTYVRFADSDIPETEFLREVAKRTGCGLLLDVNNVEVQAGNHGFDPFAYLDAFPLDLVEEIHLAGYAEARDDAGHELRIDAHDSPVRPRVWELYRSVICAHRRDADADRMGQRRAGLADAVRRGAPRRRSRESRDRAASSPMSFETTIAAFAAALTDPAAPAPAMTMGREGRPDARRFAVYRNNVAVGLIKSLEARFPVTRRLVGDDFFRGMAGAYVAANKPKSAVLIVYGADFPDFVRGFEPARDLDYLPDVAALENAWVEAYHAAEAAPWPLTALADIAPERLESLRFAIHPAARLARFATPAASIWSAHQGEGEPAPPQRWGGEDVLITRPHAEVFVRVLPEGGHDFFAALRGGRHARRGGRAADRSGRRSRAHLVGLIEAGAIAGLA